MGYDRLMTDLDPDTAPMFRDLMASVGYFIFYWGQLEVALDSEIARMQKTLEERVDGLNAVDMTRRIAEWRRLIRLSESDTNLHLASDQVGSEIAELRIHRNVIAHGLRGGDAGSWSNEGHIVCAERVENSV